MSSVSSTATASLRSTVHNNKSSSSSNLDYFELCNADNEEMDFAFLNEKPGVGRKGKKGRRHAGQAMLQRQVSNQGFLIKKCIVDASSEKQCGKKRRARLLSDHMSDFNLSVPYSLNRKNRWDLENTEEYALALAEQLEDSGDANNNFLRMAVGESEFQCCQAPGERLKSYHLVGGVEPGAAPTSYVARSNRGSTLANLVVPKGGKGASTKSSSRDENNNNISLAKSGRPESAVMMGSADWLDSPPKVNVEYLICKPHPKMYASKCFKGSRNGGVKSMRRAALELICGNSSGSLGNRYKSEQQRMDEDNIANNNAAEPPILLEDTGRTTRDLPTYTLADFLKESSPPPVFVKSPASSLAAAKRRTTITDSEIENQYNMVANPSDSVLEIEDDYKQENPSFVARLLEEVSPKKEWTFEVLTGRAVTFGIGNQSVWLSKCQTLAEEHPELDFIWSNQAKSEFSIDLTQMLLAAGGGHQNQQQSMKQPCLVVKAKFTEAIFDNKKPGQLDILVNSVFTSTDGAAHLNRLRALLDHCPSEIDRSLMELVNVVVEDFHNPLCGSMKHMNTEDFDGSYFKNEFNSHRLAHVVNMASIYQMLAVDTQKWAAWERQYVGPEELFGGDGVENGARTKKQKSVATTKKTDFGGGEGEEKFAGEEDAETEDEDDGEDFELIDLTELAQPQPLKSNSKGAKNTAAAESEEAENVPHCESCGERDLRNLVQLQSCGHHFCSVCLGTGFNHQLKAKSVPLQCLNSNCGAEVPTGILRSILPLPLANSYTIAQFSLEQNMTGVAKCPNCKGVACLDQIPTFRQVACGQCTAVWCIGCEQRPHWPLSCAQADEWFKRFENQYASLKKDPESATEIVAGAEKQRCSIAQQFFSISVQSFLRRFDSKHGLKLSKAAGKLTDYKGKRQFVELRKIALHLVEFGNAWLFFARGGRTSSTEQQQRPQNWSQLKLMLTGLRDRLDCLENDILFSSLTDSAKLMEQINTIEQSVEKILAKFTTSDRQQQQSPKQ